MNRKTILLIEDSKLHQSFIQRALQGTHYDLTIVDTGIDGLSALSKKRFDIVAIDVMLPDLNGLSVVRTIREMKQVRSLPVVMITSQSSVDYADDISELHISAFIEKSSFRAEEFIAQLDRAIESSEDKRKVEVLLLEPKEHTETYVQKATGEPRFEFTQVLDRATLESYASNSVPDVILYDHGATNSENPSWILPFYLDGSLKGIPWLVLFQNEIPRDFANQSDNRLIMPIATPCSDIVLKKNIEFLAHIHQTQMVTEEHSLELELALSELEKNRVALSKARSELTQRKNTFGDILLKIGDEIKRPLTPILGYSEGLKRSSQQDSWRSAIDGIANNGRYLAQVVEDVLSIAAIEKNRFAINKQKFDLLAIVNDLREVARIRARANNVSFAVRFENDIPADVLSDPTLIKQMLRGLIDNAVKFTSEGSIELKLFYDEKLNQLHLSVTDTGTGIPAETLTKILAPSAISLTNTTLAAGSGFGVSYVRFAAEQLGGELRVESKPGVGSTFTVIIDPGPCVENVSPELAYTILELGARDAELNPAELRGTILISDVSVESQKLYTYLLDRTEISFTFARDEFETLDKAFSLAPDMLITDALQNNEEGFGFIKSLRKRGFTKPILCISAFQYEEQKRRCLDIGCDAYLDTPFRVERFYENLATLLGNEVNAADVSKETSPAKLPQATSELPTTLLPVEMSGDSVVESLVIEFIDMLPQQVSRITTSLLARDHDALIDAAKELVSAGQLYGYPLLAETAEALAKECRTASPAELEVLSQRLNSIVAAIKRGRAKIIEAPSGVLATVTQSGASDARAAQKKQNDASTSKARSVESPDDTHLQEEIHSLFVDEPLSPTKPQATAQANPSVTKNTVTKDSVTKNVVRGEVNKSTTTENDTAASDLVEVDETGFFDQIPLATEAEAVKPAPQTGHAAAGSVDDLSEVLEQVGDALMKSDWQEASLAMEEVIAEVFLLNINEASQVALKLKVALQKKSLEKSATLLDELISLTLGQTAPTTRSATESSTVDVDSEIDALLSELEAEVGALPDKSESLNTAPSEPVISDTSIYRLFDLEDQLKEKRRQEREALERIAQESQNVEFLSTEDFIKEHTTESVVEALETSEPGGEEVANLDESDLAMFDSDELAVSDKQESADLSSSSPSTTAESEAEEVGAVSQSEPVELTGEAEASNLGASQESLEATNSESLFTSSVPRADADGAIYSTLVEDEPSTAPLILDFLEELKDLVVQLRTAFGQEDPDRMKEIASEVYGSAGICGYESCAKLAKQLNNELDEGNEKTRVAPLLSELETVCEAMFKGKESLLNY